MLPTDNEHATLVKGIYFQPRTGADYGVGPTFPTFDAAVEAARKAQKVFEYDGGKRKELMRVWVEMRVDFSYEPSRTASGGGERMGHWEVFPHCVVAETAKGYLPTEIREPIAQAGIAELEKAAA